MCFQCCRGIRRAGVTIGHRMLLLAGVVALCAAAATFAVPAFATNEPFEYPKEGYCQYTNGPENYITNVFGINHAAEGNCTLMWRDSGGGNAGSSG